MPPRFWSAEPRNPRGRRQAQRAPRAHSPLHAKHYAKRKVSLAQKIATARSAPSRTVSAWCTPKKVMPEKHSMAMTCSGSEMV
eukprot:scaffold16508_cov66-Phaeocystis_antarctica.AAC.1